MFSVCGTLVCAAVGAGKKGSYLFKYYTNLTLKGTNLKDAMALVRRTLFGHMLELLGAGNGNDGYSEEQDSFDDNSDGHNRDVNKVGLGSQSAVIEHD